MKLKKTKKLVIFGLGDISRLASFYFHEDSTYQVVGYTVDDEYMPEISVGLEGSFYQSKAIVPFSKVTDFFPPSNTEMFVSLSYRQMNKVREQKYNEAKLKGYVLANYVSSRCTMLTKNPVGDNCFILEDNTVQPFVKIGNNVTLWSGNHIGHDSIIEDHTFVSSHVVISGHCKIGKNCFLGVNATLRNSITIADECLIGAGVTIMKDTAKGQVYLPPKAFLYEKPSSEVSL